MPRPIWKGQISFGLVHVPVTLYSAERRASLHFHLLDSQNTARVRYERINEETGEEVPWNRIVKGFEYDKGNYVLLSNEELERASIELTRTIEIEQFVEVDEIDTIYFDKPYYLVPGKGGEKGYVLLREAMREAGKVGISQVVIRTRQYLAAMMPAGDALILNLLRFQQELRDREEYDFPGHDLRKFKVTKKEIDLAVQLIDGMSEPWDPNQYRDEYHDAVMKMIEKKIESGDLKAGTGDEEEPDVEPPQSINMMDVLKQSVEEASKSRKKNSTRERKSRSKKQAG